MGAVAAWLWRIRIVGTTIKFNCDGLSEPLTLNLTIKTLNSAQTQNLIEVTAVGGQWYSDV
jgi:hypothetical protein